MTIFAPLHFTPHIVKPTVKKTMVKSYEFFLCIVVREWMSDSFPCFLPGYCGEGWEVKSLIYENTSSEFRENETSLQMLILYW